MVVLLKIAFRNILKNKKRALHIGLTLALSSTLLLFSFSIGNGIERQVIDKYRDFQSGDVTVLWSNVKKIDPSDPSRLFFSAFDMKNDNINREAIKRLDEFLGQNAGEIAYSFKSVRGNGTLDTGSYAAFSMIFGLSQDEMGYLTDKRVFQLVDGVSPYSGEYGISISDDAAKKYDISLGDWVTLDCTTARSFINTQEYRVTGFYRSSSDYDSIYIYMNRDDALELLDQDPEYFQAARLFLRNPADSVGFAERLDRRLTGAADVLRAEPMETSAGFYTMIAGFLKSLFTAFVMFIMLIIAVGIRSVVRMDLFERLKEFGTLRAMGFNRLQNLLIIFFEILMLSLVCFSTAFAANLGLVALLEKPGIYVGRGAVAYALGGEAIHPLFIPKDTLPAMMILLFFSIFAPLKPGLRLCRQQITDLLAQNQRPMSAITDMLRSAIGARRKRSRRINVVTGGLQ